LQLTDYSGCLTPVKSLSIQLFWHEKAREAVLSGDEQIQPIPINSSNNFPQLAPSWRGGLNEFYI